MLAATNAPLADALEQGDFERAETLLDGANAKAAQPDGTTPLHWAVRFNELDLAKELIDMGADVRAENRYHITPLYLAAQNGSAEMIELLLNSGANANDAVNLQETALHTTARTGEVPAAKVLVDHGAVVDAREQWHGQTPLMWAVSEGHPEMTAFLIEQGADVNAVSDINEWERQTTDEPRAKWLPLGGLTPLLFAARDNCLQCAEVLVANGADYQYQDPHGVSATVMAIINGHYDMAAYLTGVGTDPNLYDDTGRGALFAATDFNTMPVSNRPPPDVVQEKISALELMQILIDAGADVNHQLTQQQPYRAKLDRGQDTIFTTGSTPLLRATKAADLAGMKVLVEAGADFSLATRNGVTPLMAAAGVGNNEADATGRFKTEDETIEAIRIALDHGADINAADRTGFTALHAAAKLGKDAVVVFLIEEGADLAAKDRNGFTPLDASLGLAGGSGGFDGSRRDVHETTAEILRAAMEARGIPTESTALPKP